MPATLTPGPRGMETTFPESPTARDAYSRDAVKRGEADIRWAIVRSEYQGHVGEFRVFADALKIQGVRVNLTPAGQQRVADALGCMLLTPKLADLIWASRQVTLPPFGMSQTAHDLEIMGTVQRMIDHSRKIDAALVSLGEPPEGIVSTVGKHWVIDDALLFHPGMAENYGWHNQQKLGPACATAAGGPGCHVIQDPGWRHNLGHLDYSQTCVLVDQQCTVDSAPNQLPAVLQHPMLSFLASHKGPMKVLRQPGV